jgi:hypothetical protein
MGAPVLLAPTITIHADGMPNVLGEPDEGQK